MDIRPYITMFARGQFFPAHAYILLRTSLEEFYEICTERRYDELDVEADEFEEYLGVHNFIKCDPIARYYLEKLAAKFEAQIEEDFDAYITERHIDRVSL